MEHRFVPRVMLALAALAVVLLVRTAPTGQAQVVDDLEWPDWIGLPLTLHMDVLSFHDPDEAHEELPGLGHKFELQFAMNNDYDPENPTNDTISVFTTPVVPDGIGVAFRKLPPGIRITALRNQLGFKYFFPVDPFDPLAVQRSCGGGSPRLTLLVDADGDGRFDQTTGDFAAHGHPNPFMACPADEWVYENLTDDGPRWEVTPGGTVPGIGVFPFSTWDTLEAAIVAAFPNHRVVAGFLVDDSCSFFPASCGEAHYDLVTVENRTLEIRQDTVKKGQK